MSIGRIHSLYRVSLLGMDNVESRARKGEKLEKRTGGFTCYRMKMFCENEFGIEYKAEVSNMGTPRNTTFCNRLLISNMLLVVRRPLHKMLPFARSFEMKIQPAFYTGTSILDVILLLPVIKIIKKHTRKNKTLACNGMSLDGFMGVNNGWGYNRGSVGGMKTTGLRVC